MCYGIIKITEPASNSSLTSQPSRGRNLWDFCKRKSWLSLVCCHDVSLDMLHVVWNAEDVFSKSSWCSLSWVGLQTSDCINSRWILHATVIDGISLGILVVESFWLIFRFFLRHFLSWFSLKNDFVLGQVWGAFLKYYDAVIRRVAKGCTRVPSSSAKHSKLQRFYENKIALIPH